MKKKKEAREKAPDFASPGRRGTSLNVYGRLAWRSGLWRGDLNLRRKEREGMEEREERIRSLSFGCLRSADRVWVLPPGERSRIFTSLPIGPRQQGLQSVSAWVSCLKSCLLSGWWIIGMMTSFRRDCAYPWRSWPYMCWLYSNLNIHVKDTDTCYHKLHSLVRDMII